MRPAKWRRNCSSRSSTTRSGWRTAAALESTTRQLWPWRRGPKCPDRALWKSRCLFLPNEGEPNMNHSNGHPPEELPDDLISSTEAAKLLRVHLCSLIRWALSGRLRAWRIGSRWRFSRTEVLAMLKRVEVPHRPRAKRQASNAEEERFVDSVL